MTANMATQNGLNLETELDWLTPAGWRLTYLSTITLIYVETLQKFRDPTRRQGANSLIEMILMTTLQSGDNLEAAEARLHCATVAYRLHEFELAYELLQDASLRFGAGRHHFGCAQWLLGMVMLRVRDMNSALQAFQRGMETFHDLKYRSALFRDWYLKRTEEMEGVLRSVFSLGRYERNQN